MNLSLIKRGVIEIISESELVSKIERKGSLRVKFGADPSAPDLHLGHTVPLRKLRHFQELGHTVVFIIGDFTAMVGDPSGRNTSRKRLSRSEVIENAKTYQEQVFKILDKSKTEVRYNSEWFDRITFEEILNLTSKYTVARMLERDDFEKRYKSGNPISVMEFLYPLMQGYDSVMVNADVEIGGTDQKFNLLVGRELQIEYGQEPQVVITLPLLEGTDGVRKMSKSFGNYIGINDNPSDMFGKIMSIPDNLILKYFELLTDVSIEEIQTLKRDMENGANPRDIKAMLAREIVSFFYGTDTAIKSNEEFDRIFKEKQIPSDIEERELKTGEYNLVSLLSEMELVPSKSEVRRLIQGGGVYIDGERVRDINYLLKLEKEVVVRIGKRKFVKLIPR
ncbi:MAG: tyrosine--tRNA ligase [Spirochaetia bacterium]|nr:tyrosine--tRNA ligase [Spirochaetota bacterium]MCX8096150.1 tyrosine--tRNA ligase [Spirochaetota bacterium]MDW8112524.1 tyrosine--tRNA ligase [Spirochaetia bacterium]